jgi:hypothetical protein
MSGPRQFTLHHFEHALRLSDCFNVGAINVPVSEEGPAIATLTGEWLTARVPAAMLADWQAQRLHIKEIGMAKKSRRLPQSFAATDTAILRAAETAGRVIGRAIGATTQVVQRVLSHDRPDSKLIRSSKPRRTARSASSSRAHVHAGNGVRKAKATRAAGR